MKPTFIFALMLFMSQISCAHGRFHSDGIYDGTSAQKTELSEALKTVQPGAIVIASEIHDFEPHHKNQIRLLKELHAAGFKVSVGMEFFDFTQQTQLDAFLAGKITEADFLKAVKWGSIPFDFYREQVLAPLSMQGKTIALNAPRSLTSAISKSGLSALSEEQKKLLPPRFELGRDIYRERFTETMIDHVPKDAITRYFEAQSVWDDTMAHLASEFIKQNPEQVLVIIVGDFHAIYGGGLPDRLRARGQSDILVFSQIKSSSDDEVTPHSEWGKRADFIWVSH